MLFLIHYNGGGYHNQLLYNFKFYNMNNYDFFRTKKYSISDSISIDAIYSNDLLSLLKDSELKEFIINKSLLSESFSKIEKKLLYPFVYMLNFV